MLFIWKGQLHPQGCGTWMHLCISQWWTGFVLHNCYGDATDVVKAVGLMSHSRWWREMDKLQMVLFWLSTKPGCFLREDLLAQMRACHSSLPFCHALSRHLTFALSLSCFVIFVSRFFSSHLLAFSLTHTCPNMLVEGDEGKQISSYQYLNEDIINGLVNMWQFHPQKGPFWNKCHLRLMRAQLHDDINKLDRQN